MDAGVARRPMHRARSLSHHGLMPTTLPGLTGPPARATARTHLLRIICALAIVWMLAACAAAHTSRANPTASPTTSPTASLTVAPTVDARAYAIYDDSA